MFGSIEWALIKTHLKLLVLKNLQFLSKLFKNEDLK